ncbi:hypothetical protein B0A48_04916 [Cryoendolithus antarcticus]|uniref:Uncharacterized protein n=1 Tax=Cryoendolithus antarcticus TaxID=1507870 RepID=A0A1V8TE18_9PEZI|nr:hypothetical protein B0A48_04916 [Cryoendolithus antarcticus]
MSQVPAVDGESGASDIVLPPGFDPITWFDKLMADEPHGVFEGSSIVQSPSSESDPLDISQPDISSISAQSTADPVSALISAVDTTLQVTSAAGTPPDDNASGKTQRTRYFGDVGAGQIDYSNYPNNNVNVNLPTYLPPHGLVGVSRQGTMANRHTSIKRRHANTSAVVPAGYPYLDQKAASRDMYGHPSTSHYTHHPHKQLVPATPVSDTMNGGYNAPHRPPVSRAQQLPAAVHDSPTPAQRVRMYHWQEAQLSKYRPIAPAAPMTQEHAQKTQGQASGGAITHTRDGGRGSHTSQIVGSPINPRAKPSRKSALHLTPGTSAHTQAQQDITAVMASNDSSVDPTRDAGRGVSADDGREPPRFFETKDKNKILSERKAVRKAAEKTTGIVKVNMLNTLSITVQVSTLRIHDLDHALSIADERMPLTQNGKADLDWAVIDAERDTFIVRLIDALNASPEPFPDDAELYTEYGLEMYDKWEQSHKDKCDDVLAGQFDKDLFAEARCVVVWKTGMELYRNEHGIRVFDRKVNDGPDCDLNWRERFEAIIATMKKYRIVDLEVLSGQRIPEFVTNPIAFGKQKADYCWINIKKKGDVRDIKKTEAELAAYRTAVAQATNSSTAVTATLAVSATTQPQQGGGAPQVPSMISTPSSSTAAANAAPKRKKRAAPEAFGYDEGDVAAANHKTAGPATHASKKSKTSLQLPPTPSTRKTRATKNSKASTTAKARPSATAATTALGSVAESLEEAGSISGVNSAK